MEIIVNGKTERVSEKVSIREFLHLKSIPIDRVVVELNQDIIKRVDWQRALLQDRDRLEIIKIVGGG